MISRREDAVFTFGADWMLVLSASTAMLGVARRNVKIIGLSVDPVGDHAKWADDIKQTQGLRRIIR
jgi:alkyl hydroperoxide reductase subunit AhpC